MMGAVSMEREVRRWVIAVLMWAWEAEAEAVEALFEGIEVEA